MDNMIRYQLPDGRIVSIPFDVCRAASVVAFELASGGIVDAVIVRGER